MGDLLQEDQEEIVIESPSEKLLEFLLKSGCETGIFSDALAIFNPSFDLDSLMDQLKVILSEELEEFQYLIQDQICTLDNKDYVHLTAIATTEAKVKSRITRKFKKLNSNAYDKPKHLHCPLHQIQPCNLVQKSLVFLFFLVLED